MLLLASASPARRRLLEQAAIPHGVQASGVDEQAFHAADPEQLVQRLARAKARAVAAALTDQGDGEAMHGRAAGITSVLGCDSLLVFGGEVFGKPADPDAARRRWQRMAGGCGALLTGHCLLAGPAAATTVAPERITTVITRVWFADLTDAEIGAYVHSGEPLQCAGGFALEGRGGALVERIEGCFSNVIGLSLPLLRRWLSS